MFYPKLICTAVAGFCPACAMVVERECYRLFKRRIPDNMEIGDADLPNVPAPAIPLDLRIDLIAAVAALPAPYRTVLILRALDELTAPETATQLGISTEAVKSRLHRARAMVRERLVKSGYWDPTTDTEPRKANTDKGMQS